MFPEESLWNKVLSLFSTQSRRGKERSARMSESVGESETGAGILTITRVFFVWSTALIRFTGGAFTPAVFGAAEWKSVLRGSRLHNAGTQSPRFLFSFVGYVSECVGDVTESSAASWWLGLQTSRCSSGSLHGSSCYTLSALLMHPSASIVQLTSTSGCYNPPRSCGRLGSLCRAPSCFGASARRSRWQQIVLTVITAPVCEVCLCQLVVSSIYLLVCVREPVDECVWG